LEHNPAIAAAWLNRAGTAIAVQWADGATPAARAAAIAGTAGHSHLSIAELNNDKREAALRTFPSGGWYTSSQVERLSEEEGDIIAERLVRRVRTAVTLCDEDAAHLSTAIGAAIKRGLTGASPSKQSIEDGVLEAGRPLLDEDGMAALKHAFSRGYEALPGEK
jgi:hypothetical protein